MYSTSVQCYINVIILIIIMFIGLHRTIFHYIKQIQVPVQISIKVLKTDFSRVYIIFVHVLFLTKLYSSTNSLFVMLTNHHAVGLPCSKALFVVKLVAMETEKKLHFRMEKIHNHFSLGCPIVDCQIFRYFFFKFLGRKILGMLL